MPGRKFENAKQFLELLGVDGSQWNNLFQDQPLGPADEESINRILYHLPRIGSENSFRWRKSEWSFDEVVRDPAAHQGHVLLLRGRATALTRIDLPAEVAERYQHDHYYRVRAALGNDRSAIVCTREIPRAWQKLETLDERIEVEGVFLKTSPTQSGPPELVFAANRVAWLPDRVHEEGPITQDIVLLADQGFDVGLLDPIRGSHMRPWREEDREPFYHLLGAMQNVPPNDPALLRAPPIDIAASIKSPDQQIGNLVAVDGIVRRIDRIEIKGGDIQARFGLDHYYSLYVFVPLKNQSIRWTRDKNDKNPRVFENHFPVTVCVPELPPGLTAGPEVREHVALAGTFFKVWTYTPQGAGNDLPQPSPVVVSPAVRIVVAAEKTDSESNFVLGGVFVVLLGVIAVVVWRMNRSDVRSKREMLEKRTIRAKEVDLRDLEGK